MKIGVFGGTFDPIHNGHLHIAKTAFKSLNLDKLIFIPNSLPPHKSNVTATAEDRMNMVKLAISGADGFEIDDYELKSKKFSYTYRTLTYIKEKYKNCDLFFIAGADNIKQIEKWKRPDIIYSLAKVAFITRPGFELDTDFEYKDKSVFIEVDGVDISSTLIRKKIDSMQSVSDLIPKAVEKYIKDNYIYSYISYKNKLKPYINPKRYEHSLNVAKTAVELARIYGVNENKAYIAGLLHDCAKDYEIEKQKELINEKNKFLLFENELSYPKIIHAVTGAIVAETDFKITDSDILSAIRYHTIGGTEMKPLDKIIFVADMIEPKRDYKGIEILRELAYNNLNKAIIQSIDNTIVYIGVEKIQKDVLILRDYLKERENERI